MMRHILRVMMVNVEQDLKFVTSGNFGYENRLLRI
jgi:hypothetical protein